MRRDVCVLAMMLCGSLMAGCGGDGVKLVDVSGTATFAGQPIAYGQVEFLPDSSKQHSGPAGSAEIVDGKFDTRLNGLGVIAGPHKVQITAYAKRPAPSISNDETAATEVDAPLFVGYSMDMDVPGGELTIAVPEEAKGFSQFGGSLNGAKPTSNNP